MSSMEDVLAKIEEADILCDLKLIDEVILFFEEKIKEVNNDHIFHYYLGLCYLIKGEVFQDILEDEKYHYYYSKSEPEIELSIRQDPDSIEWLCTLCRLYGRLADTKNQMYSVKIKEIIKRVLDKDHNNAYIWLVQGMNTYKSPWFAGGNTGEGIKYIKKAISLDPKFLRSYYHLADIYILQKKYKKAKNLLEKSLSIEPRYYRAQMLLEKIK